MNSKKLHLVVIVGVLLAGAVLALGGYLSPEASTYAPALAMSGMINFKAGERLAIAGTVDPKTVTTEQFTDVVDMSKFHQCLGIALLGDLAAGAVDFAAYTCDSDGNNAVELKDTTQLAADASANDNKQLVISVRAEDLIDSGKTHIKFGLTIGSTGGPASVLALGVDARSGLASDNDLASVAEIQL